MALVGAVIAIIIGMIFAVAGKDPVIAFHGWVFAAASALAGVIVLKSMTGDRNDADDGGYMDGPIRVAAIATVFWGVIGFLVGDIIAWQLAFPALNFDMPWTSFARLRPVHTSAVIFAFGGNALLATSLYVVQRTCRARVAGRWSPWFIVWGYQLFLVLAASGYVLGVTQSKEYAEPEWYVDLWLTVVWVVYLLVFLGTLARRKEPHIYVA
ncbi:MAG: cbb3-type cytochrome c oxidase subunit I, partial [Pirellulales bacterium]|nr:cbb3-type cytochrome c oxidase subunit I [Pirellulales bacterium]